MPTFSLDDLITPLDRKAVSAKIYEVIEAVGTTTTAWKAGAVVRTMIAASSVVISAFSELTASLARAGFVELASGKWLELAAWHVYRVEKSPATYATGMVTLVNAGGGVYAFDAGDLVVSNPQTGKTYRNSAAVALDAMSTATIPIVASEVGSSSTSPAGAITELVTTLLGVNVVNAAAVIGRDEEDDAALRVRCLEKLGSLSPFGPWDAYNYAARTATRADGTLVGVTRIRSVKTGYGDVRTYVASASGTVTGNIADASSDLGLIHAAIQERAAPLAVTAWVASAVPVAIPVAYHVTLTNTSGLTQAELAFAIEAKLVAWMKSQPIGGHVVGATAGRIYRDAIATAIGSTRNEIFHVELDLPATDVVLAENQVPVLGPVTAASIVQVPPGEGSA